MHASNSDKGKLCLPHPQVQREQLFRYDHQVSTRGCTGLSTFPSTGTLSTSSPGAVHAGGICYESENMSLI